MEFLKLLTYRSLQRIVFPRRAKSPPYLPDKIIVDILSRLPSEHVLQCRVVCKNWLALTRSSYFVALHVKRFIPLPVQLFQTIIPVTSRSGCWDKDSTIHLFMLDEQETTTPAAAKLRKGVKLRLTLSAHGLVVFRHMTCGSRYEVWNLFTQERVTVKAPPKFGNYCFYSQVHAIFLHRSTKDYRMLLSCPRRCSLQLDFYVYSFNTKSWRQLPTSCRLSYLLEFNVNPVVLDGGATLHWMSEKRFKHSSNPVAPCAATIIAFDTRTEKFRVMPHPGKKCWSPRRAMWHRGMCLFETKQGLLGFCSMVTQVVDIWVLEDYNNWSWTKRSSIDLSYWFSEWGKSPQTVLATSIDNYKLMVLFPDELCLVDLDDDNNDKKKNIVKVLDKKTIMGELRLLMYQINDRSNSLV